MDEFIKVVYILYGVGSGAGILFILWWVGSSLINRTHEAYHRMVFRSHLRMSPEDVALTNGHVLDSHLEQIGRELGQLVMELEKANSSNRRQALAAVLAKRKEWISLVMVTRYFFGDQFEPLTFLTPDGAANGWMDLEPYRTLAQRLRA